MKRYLKMLICFVVVLFCSVAVIASSTTAEAANNKKWISAWGTAPSEINITGMSAVGSIVGEVTARVVINPTATGEKIRLKLSNYYGEKPLVIYGMTVAKSVPEKNGEFKSQIDKNTLKMITFNEGEPDISVDAGDEIYTDELVFDVKANEPIAVTIHIKEYQDIGTMGLSGASTYLTTGEATRVEDFDLLPTLIDEAEMLDTISKILETFTGTDKINLKLAYNFIKIVPAVSSLEVLTDDSGYSVVVIGDSTVANEFPEYLAKAIVQQNNVENVGIVGKGLIGNRLLGEGLGLASFIYGDSMTSRFYRDVLKESGVEYVIMKVGANDIIHPVCEDIISQYPNIKQATAEEIIEGYRRIIKECHDANIKIVIASITQWKGNTRDYFDTGSKYLRTEEEFRKDWQIAQEVNEWLTSTDEHDGYVDLTTISANPLDEAALLPEYTVDGMNPSAECQKLWSSYFPHSLIGVGTKAGGVRIEKREYALSVGTTKEIIATVIPETAQDKSLTWESSNPEVATVDENGVVTAVANGNATIRCKTVVGGFTASCTVTVTTKPDSIMLDYTEREIYTTKSVTLEAIVYPESANDRSVIWSSSNTKVAKVDQNGTVTGVGAGVATITAKTTDSGLTAKCVVNVLKKKEVQSIVVDYKDETVKSKTIYTNGTNIITLGYTVSPSNATFKDVIWTSSNPAVATVDPMGKVRAVSVGKTVIKCSSEDNPMVTATCTVYVKVRATDIKISSSSIKVYETKSKTLKATVSPEDASNKSVTWKSSDTKIAKVDSNGKVTGVKAGTAYITATTANGKYSVKCKVTVQKTIYSEKVMLDKSSLTLNDGKSYYLEATVFPDNTTTKTLVWSSSNKKVAEVDQYGEVTAINPGTAYIYCKTKDTGVSVRCKVTVKEVKPTSISFSSKTIEVEYGDIVKLKPTIKPSNATDKTLKWSSSDPSVVKVSQVGNVKGLKAGKSAVITVTTNTGNFKAKITVKVSPISVKKVSLSRTSVALSKGKTYKLDATVTPSNATNKTITWTSSNPKVATVDKNGKVTTIKNGTAVITCKSANGKTATCKITVRDIKVTGVELDMTSVLADVGSTFTVKATVIPNNATNQKVVWSSSDKSIAKISSSGKVTAVAPGVCQIIATTVDGEHTAVCMITVR